MSVKFLERVRIRKTLLDRKDNCLSIFSVWASAIKTHLLRSSYHGSYSWVIDRCIRAIIVYYIIGLGPDRADRSNGLSVKPNIDLQVPVLICRWTIIQSVASVVYLVTFLARTQCRSHMWFAILTNADFTELEI